MKTKACQSISAPRFLASLANGVYSHLMEKSRNLMDLRTGRIGPVSTAGRSAQVELRRMKRCGGLTRVVNLTISTATNVRVTSGP